LPRAVQDRFPETGTHLERYSAVLTATEVNSSFRQVHRAATYARWARSVPASFRFCVKVPKAITHHAKLARTEALQEPFLASVRELGDKLGCMLVQLPPKLALDLPVAHAFFRSLRQRHRGEMVVEPRHGSWFTADADAMLRDLHVGRVAADPAPHAGAERPGGWRGIAYYRLHGSPRMYYSAYDDARLAELGVALARVGETAGEVWCIFDNTTLGAAFDDALRLAARLGVTVPAMDDASGRATSC
jgi:uncharacterized protein YecE (DUF72 family)